MLLTLTTTAPAPAIPASDLGFLLHKHPGRAQSYPVAGGTAHVFYPEATDERCTVAVLLEVDPIALVRGRKGGGEGFALGAYVNDRPYAASSLLAVAMARVFRTAMSGRCDDRPELAAGPLPLTIRIPALPCAGGPGVAEQMFAPLGWRVELTTIPADPEFPQWGDSAYVDLELRGSMRLADALTHLYVLLPVLDNAQHYWVGPAEVDKLVRAGGSWLATHPHRDLITRRYLAHQGSLVRSAVDRLTELDGSEPSALDAEPSVADAPGTATTPPSLAVLRRQAVLDAIQKSGATRVLDLGCGEGALLAALLGNPAYAEIVGVDVSVRALERASRRLRMDPPSWDAAGDATGAPASASTGHPGRGRDRLRLFQSSLTYQDDRLAGFDAAVLMEVIEHVDPPRLRALERTVFGSARPGTVIVTTPNADYNIRYPDLDAGTHRHHDHRFEWTREEFRAWARNVAEANGYVVTFTPVGEDDPEVGPPTQLATFVLTSSPTTGSAA